MQKYIVFSIGQIKGTNGKWKYEANTKFHVTKEDSKYYYIGEDRFDKSKNIFRLGDIVNEHKKD